MRILGRRRAWPAVIIACGAIVLGLSSALKAAPQEWPGAAPPFGLFVSGLSTGGGVVKKWAEVERQIEDDRVQLALCDGDSDRCVSPAALRLLAIVDQARARQGRARLGEVNRAINLAIRPMSDLAQYGQIDVWSSPLSTFTHGAGDCEDYAIAKFAALQMAGIAADDLRIVILRDTLRGEDHAVAAARLDGHWLMLDNRHMAMVEDVDITHYQPLFVLDASGVMKYLDAPLMANLPGQPTPGSIDDF